MGFILMADRGHKSAGQWLQYQAGCSTDRSPPGHLPKKVKILAGVTGHQNNCFTVKGIWSE